MSAEKTSTTAASEARRPPTGMIIKIAAILLVTVVVYFLPVPDGVDPRGMHMAGIFAGTILGLILQPLPTTSVALIGLAVGLARTMTTRQAAAIYQRSAGHLPKPMREDVEKELGLES